MWSNAQRAACVSHCMSLVCWISHLYIRREALSISWSWGFMTGSCACARQSWTKEKDSSEQVHSAVKAPLFNSRRTAPQHLCYWPIWGPRHSKFVPDSLEKCWLYNLDLSAVLKHAIPHVFLLHSGLLFTPLHTFPPFPASILSLVPFISPLSACVYYSSKKWHQGRDKEIRYAPLLMPNLLLCF